MRNKPFDVFHRPRDRRGFTLVELLIVMSIIAILATIAVPMYLGYRTRAMQKEAATHLESLRLLQEQYFAEHAFYAPEDPATSPLGICAQDNPGNIATIKGELPAFRPGRGEDLLFSYCVEKDMDFDGNATAEPCFLARAFGNSNYQISGQEFKVDCNNVKNY